MMLDRPHASAPEPDPIPATVRRPALAGQVAAARHSRRVRLLKWLLPAGGALIIGGMVVAVSLVTWLPGIKVSSALITSEGLTMVEPRLSGHARNRAYDVTAAKAFQNIANPKIVRFVDVDGRIEMNAPNWAKLLARAGVYDANTERLHLSDGVTLETTDGYKLKLDHAAVDLTAGRLTTEGPVAVTGPNLSIDAVGAEVSDNGAVILLKSQVRLTLIPKSATDAPPLVEPPRPVASQGAASPPRQP